MSVNMAYAIEIGTLEQSEIDGLMLMREEEKLAKDVYLKLYETHNLPIFNNIASSEQTHMDAILVLLERYGLDDPASTEQGVFNDVKLQELYTALVSQGGSSLLEALKVGATIEDLDIFDLNKLISETDKAGAAVNLGYWSPDVSAEIDRQLHLFEHGEKALQKMSDRCFSVTDGLGVKRVVEAMGCI